MKATGSTKLRVYACKKKTKLSRVTFKVSGWAINLNNKINFFSSKSVIYTHAHTQNLIYIYILIDFTCLPPNAE